MDGWMDFCWKKVTEGWVLLALGLLLKKWWEPNIHRTSQFNFWCEKKVTKISHPPFEEGYEKK